MARDLGHHWLLKPANLQPAAGVAVKRMRVPRRKATLHTWGHEMPAGTLRTVPFPSSVTNATSWKTKLGAGCDDASNEAAAAVTTSTLGANVTADTISR